MRLILHRRSFYVLGAILIALVAVVFIFNNLFKSEPKPVTATVERGDVREVVSISGLVEAKNAADLAFPASGLVTEVLVEEGDQVEVGDVLATLSLSKLVADKIDAMAALEKAKAARDELVAGPRSEARQVSEQKVTNAKSNLEKVTREQNETVQNLRRTLLSSSLIARTNLADETATAPTISGTYTCTEEGQYKIEPYNYAANRTFPFRFSGLEYGRSDAHFESPGSFGECGLFIQFESGENYDRSEWLIDIPNTQSSVYQSNLNNYQLALIEREEAIKAAEDALKLAEQETSLENAAPRSEELRRAEAEVTQAEARLKAINADIADHSIIAPFSGVVTDVSILPGESVTNETIITLLSDEAFELTARVPEIDITKIAVGQTTNIVFDAKSSETLTGTIAFISPLSTEIDGVAYFKTTIAIKDTPKWIRSGLNADIDVIINQATDVLRVPKRFVIEKQNAQMVQQKIGEEITTQEVEVVFSGNDGFVQINGLNEGDTIVAP